MNYLNAVRFHFAGTFRADVSTVNNDANHYNNDSFVPDDQEYGAGASNGWWQPDGTGCWRLAGVKITRACYQDGTSTTDSSDDSLLSWAGADAGDRTSAKLVDLDPQQQLVSQIWGLQFRVVDPSTGHVALSGEFEPTGFFDIWWNRQKSQGSGDIAASACYQSVLTDVKWGDISGSTCLQQLKAASPDILSIKFMTDSYAMSGPDQSFGRIVGTVGPAVAAGPHHFVPGRQLIPQNQLRGGSSMPVGDVNYAVCNVDETRRKILVDFGNALPTTNGSALSDIGPVLLGINDAGQEKLLPLGSSDYQSSDTWYETTAGVEEFPKGRELTDEEMAALANNLLVVYTTKSGQNQALVFESEDGVYVRPDNFVFRLNYQETKTCMVYATRFGKPLPNVEIESKLDPRGLQALPTEVGLPITGISFPDTVETDDLGRAELALTGGDVENWREPKSPAGDYGLEGQLYGIRCTLKELPIGSRTNFNFTNFISVMVYGKGEVPANVTWHDHIEPIFQQYSNLYPRPHGPRNYRPKYPNSGSPPALNPIVDLSNYEEVVGFARFIKIAMSLPIHHPNHMPVVRDLSAWKRAMILKWIDNVGGDGLPLKGHETTQNLTPLASRSSAESVDRTEAELGGKTAAALRMTPNTESLLAEATPKEPTLFSTEKSS